MSESSDPRRKIHEEVGRLAEYLFKRGLTKEEKVSVVATYASGYDFLKPVPEHELREVIDALTNKVQVPVNLHGDVLNYKVHTNAAVLKILRAVEARQKLAHDAIVGDSTG